jgi:hypothetical protein
MGLLIGKVTKQNLKVRPVKKAIKAQESIAGGDLEFPTYA